jgi:hypothetical protein
MKKHLLILIFCCVFAFASSTNAQTKASGTIECGKADLTSTYVIQIPEQEGSSFKVNNSKCKWTKSFTLEGIESTHNEGVSFIETTRTSVQEIFSDATYYKNGDKTLRRGTGTYDPKTMITTYKWIFVGGTGKFKGIKGGGTSSCKAKSAELGGGITCEVSGEYTLTATKK